MRHIRNIDNCSICNNLQQPGWSLECFNRNFNFNLNRSVKQHQHFIYIYISLLHTTLFLDSLPWHCPWHRHISVQQMVSMDIQKSNDYFNLCFLHIYGQPSQTLVRVTSTDTDTLHYPWQRPRRPYCVADVIGGPTVQDDGELVRSVARSYHHWLACGSKENFHISRISY